MILTMIPLTASIENFYHYCKVTFWPNYDNNEDLLVMIIIIAILIKDLLTTATKTKYINKDSSLNDNTNIS